MRVAVVGAGIAGLSAGRRLQERGHDVLVVDKARGPGGRTSTRRVERAAFDHGAPGFRATDPEFRKTTLDWLRRGVVERWNPRSVRLPGAEPVVREERFRGQPGMSALCRDLVGGLDLRLGLRVEALDRGERGWRLHARLDATLPLRFHDGLLDGFDAVVVATPAPQAVPLLAESPALARRLEKVRLLPTAAALLAFERPLDLPFDEIYFDDSVLDRAVRQPCDTEAWVLHATQAWSASDEVRLERLVDRFARLLGRSPPTCFHAALHLWRYALVERALGEPCLWDAERGIGVCGDGCLGPSIQSAWLSGTALANRID